MDEFNLLVINLVMYVISMEDVHFNNLVFKDCCSL